MGKGYGQGIHTGKGYSIAPQIGSLFAHHATPSAKNQALPAVLVQIQRITAWACCPSSLSPITDGCWKDSPTSQARCHDIMPHSGHHAHRAEPGRFTSSYELRCVVCDRYKAFDTWVPGVACTEYIHLQPSILRWEMEIELWICYGELDNIVTSGVGIIFALLEATCEESARSDSYALGTSSMSVFGDFV